MSKAFDFEYNVFENVKYLNHQSLTIEGVEFLFTTLWSRTGTSLIKNKISDFKTCKYADGRYNYKHHDELHRRSVQWLNKELAMKKTMPRVVVSHFVPCKEVDAYPSGNDYNSDIMKRYFVADLGYRLPGWDVDYWIYGHNHWGIDKDIFDIKFRSNQFGYVQAMEHRSFEFDKVIQIGS